MLKAARMSRLKMIVQRFVDENDRTEAWIARQMGVAGQTLNSWSTRGLSKLPEAWMIKALARVTGTPYRDVLDAILEDIGYLPASAVPDCRPVKAPVHVLVEDQ